MITTKIQWNGRNVTVGGVGLQKFQMLKLGQYGLDGLKARVQSGVGSDDSPMKPLTRPYIKAKTRAGHSGFRDLTFSGDMLANLTVRYADESQVKIALTERLQRSKALSNEKRTPWLSWSESDQSRIIAYAAKLFQANVSAVSRLIQQRSRSIAA